MDHQPRKIQRNAPSPEVDLERLATEYLNTKSMSDKITARLDELKKHLSKIADDKGYADDKGNRWLKAGEYQLKRERRVSKFFDAAAAEEWAVEQGLWDDLKVVTVTETIDHDKLLALAWTNKEYSAVIESFEKEKVTWAFKVEAKKSYDDDES